MAIMIRQIANKNKQIFKRDCSLKLAIALLGAILVFRVILTVFVFRDGFIALTADDYGRIISAANWARRPFGLWSGPWLPFHMYFFGLLLKLKWSLFWMPRLVIVIFGMISIIIIFFIGKTLFKNNISALIGAALLSLNPGHVWLSSTPLTELMSNTFILIAIWQFLKWLGNKKRKSLVLSSLFLAIANGFRFESWVYAAIMSLIVVGVLIRDFVKKETKLKESLVFFLVICLPWIFSVLWLIGNYIATNDFFFSIRDIQSYKIENYSDAKQYSAYFKLFFGADPFLFIVSPFLLFKAWQYQKKQIIMKPYLLLSLLPLFIYLIMHNGQVEPTGNYVRYFMPFTFFFYPLLGGLLTSLVSLQWKNISIGIAIVLIIFFVVVPTQIETAFTYHNDPSAIGIDVGRELTELVKEEGGTALTENGDWHCIYVQIGANDDGFIYMDRPFIWVEKGAESLLVRDPEQFNACVREKDITVIAFKDPQLVEIMENDSSWKKISEVHSYTLFRRLSLPAESTSPTDSCPLLTGFN